MNAYYRLLVAATILSLAGVTAFGSPAKSTAKAPEADKYLVKPFAAKETFKNFVKSEKKSFVATKFANTKIQKADFFRVEKSTNKAAKFGEFFSPKEFTANADLFKVKAAKQEFGSTKFASLKAAKQFDFDDKFVKDNAKQYNQGFNKIATS